MAVQGTWGPQTGVLGFLNPFSRDLGSTEWLSGGNAPSWANNPAVYQAANTTQKQYSQDVAQNAQYAAAQQGTAVNPYAPYKPAPTTPTQQTQTTNTQPTQNTGGGQPPNPYTTYIRGKKLADMIRDGEADQWGNPIQRGGGVQDMSAQVRNDINQGYNNYFATLDSILNNDLPAQQQAQLGIAQAQGQQATNTLGAQREQGLADLGTQRRQTEQNQAKSLLSLADDVRNQFKAGQVYLGARGAGDSSAANQYSYAISKMGNQGRGNIMQQSAEIQNQINDRETRLKTTYDTELKNIQSAVDQKVMEVAQWFANAQAQLKQAKAQGQLSQGQDLANLSKQLLQTATQQMLATQQEASNRRSMLDQWALNNSKTIQEAKTNLSGVANYQAPGISNPGITGQLAADSSGNVSYNRGAGYSNIASTNNDWLKKLYGMA